MSVKSPYQSDETRIPLSAVFITVGLIIILTVVVIWLITPSRMPQPLYDLVGPYLVRTAARPLPTPAAVAAVPTPVPRQENSATTILLPEAPVEANPEYPDYFVSAAEAVRVDPTAGKPIRIVIPATFTDAPVVEVELEAIKSDGETYYQWQVPGGYTAGWHSSSARLGEPGNTVINGHHNLEGEVFRNLIDLEMGDEIIVYDAKKAYYYEVTDKELLPERDEPLAVRLENARWIEPTTDERITIVTCWPYTDNTHRLIVVARPKQ